MSGVMPAGQKSFSNINTVAGQPSTNQVNLGSTAAQYLGKVPTTTWVRMSDMSNRGLIIGQVMTTGSTANSPIGIQSPFGESVTSGYLDLNTAFGSGTWANVPNGSTFYAQARVVATWATANPPTTPADNTNRTHAFTKGVSASPQHGGSGSDKNWYIVCEYDAPNNRIRVYGYYSGDSTSFKNGQVWLDRVALV